MKVFFNQLFDYNFYCNKKIIELCAGESDVSEKTIELFSHILNAHHIWNSRIIGKQPEFDVWQIHTITSWNDIHYDNQRSTFEITSNVDDFDKRIDYENSKGRLFANNVKDILFHILNHSTHHRGQISMNLRANNIEPMPLDYVFYKR
ncbi:DinB family protein [Aurantibacter sp.]|uniref:DinB family protein n=1 Tax=Aurantibacter sp. TaxID=2807103 RepID=UPI0032634324